MQVTRRNQTKYQMRHIVCFYVTQEEDGSQDPVETSSNLSLNLDIDSHRRRVIVKTPS